IRRPSNFRHDSEIAQFLLWVTSANPHAPRSVVASEKVPSSASYHGPPPSHRSTMARRSLPQNGSPSTKIHRHPNTPRVTEASPCWRAIAFTSESLMPASTEGLSSVYCERLSPLWVKSRHFAKSRRCPLYPQKRTLVERVVTSAKCQKRTYAPQQTRPIRSPRLR